MKGSLIKMNISNIKLDKNSPIPLYFQIKEDMIKKINEGDLHDGEPLPSETKLMEIYDVSRTTIRQAVDMLVYDGYLEKRRGVGTFVAEPKTNYWDLAELCSFDEEAQRLGLKSRTKILNMENIKLNKDLENVFDKKYETFYKLERLRFIEDEPTELVTTFVPADFAPNLEQFNFSETSLFEVLNKEYGVKINFAEKTISAINADKKDALLLKIKENSAIQLVKTITYSDQKNPIEYSISRDRGIAAQFKLILRKKKN